MDDFVSRAAVGVNILLVKFINFIEVMLHAIFLVLRLIEIFLLEFLHERFV